MLRYSFSKTLKLNGWEVLLGGGLFNPTLGSERKYYLICWLKFCFTGSKLEEVLFIYLG